MRREFAAPQLLNSCRLDKLLSFRQSLANSFDVLGLDCQGGGNGPYRETISSNTCASQNILLYLVQLLHLNGAQVGAGLEQMSSKAVAQRVRMDTFLDACSLAGLVQATSAT